MSIPISTLQGVLGLAGFLFLAWLLSENRRAFPWVTVAGALVLQMLLVAAAFKLPGFKQFFLLLNELVLALEKATGAGTAFVFGYLGGAEAPFPTAAAGSTFILAFQALPLVLVVSALSSLLFYWRVLPLLVGLLSKALEKSMGIGGALGLGVGANVFVGMVEAPLLVRPYMREITRSELFALMTAGMATIAGTMMALYASILGPVIGDAMGHILIASLASAPAAIAIAAVMIPPQARATAGKLAPERVANSAMDAVTRGTLQGMELLINIVAMLIVLVALVKLANLALGVLPDLGGEPLTLQRILGVVMAPMAWLMGIPWKESFLAGGLLGTKTVLNELIAYLNMADLPPDALSQRSRLILSYAMCGFANFGSLGIMIGGLGTMVPERRAEIVGLGLRSIVAGTLATMMTGAVVGLFV